MRLNLSKPIIFFDLETTGLNIGKDKIIEISLLKIFPDGKEESYTQLINPETPISYFISEITNIFDKDVADMPTFKDIADKLIEFFDDCDLAGFNSSKFDLPLLVEEFLRCGKKIDLRNRYHVDVQTIFHKMEPRNLSAAYQLYCKKELLAAHEAEADTRASYEVLKAQLDKYQSTEYEDRDGRKFIPVTNDIAKLSSFSSENKNVDLAGHIIFNEKGEEVFAFGKHKGLSVEKIFRTEPSYYDWMQKADFPLYTKEVIRVIKERMLFN